MKRRVLTVIMDGVGVRDSSYGNAVRLAATPNLDWLKRNGLYRELQAHGTFVGLPSDSDLGNSEVGHNAFGAGRIFDQGAKLIDTAIASGRAFQSKTWQQLVEGLKAKQGTLHLLGLLSDGNVHAHIDHLLALIGRAKDEQIATVRIHALLDGRDVGPESAETYVETLNQKLSELNNSDFDCQVASGGGRMTTTMDRYEADWSMVERGWQAHVRGQAEHYFESLREAVQAFRDQGWSDQNFPAFVIGSPESPRGPIVDGDAVVLWNFRGDRAIEISEAFTADDFSAFDRGQRPEVFYAGMMEYDGDRHIPNRYIVEPPHIDDTLSEYLLFHNLRQFACSETQKYGHVTFFWNGNRSGYLDESKELYCELLSDKSDFNLKPWMQAAAITDATIKALADDRFDAGRINYANGDMVGHTGDLRASVVAVAVVDLQIGRLIAACQKTDTILIVTADHGNCDEMFDIKDGAQDLDWRLASDPASWPKPKTSHTTNRVPFYFYDPRGVTGYQLSSEGQISIAAVAATIIEGAGLPAHGDYLPAIVRRKG